MSSEELKLQFLRTVDQLLPASLGGASLHTDRVILKNQDTVCMQFWTDGVDGVSGFVAASGRELEMFKDNLSGLAIQRIGAAVKQLREAA